MKESFFVILLLILFPSGALARVTPNDMYQAKRDNYEQQLSKLSSVSQEKVKKVDQLLVKTNQKVSARFDTDIAKLAAILAEVRIRRGLEDEPTTVAFGQGETKLESADYWVNYAQEAVAYQKIQDYTPNITTEANLKTALASSKNKLSNDLKSVKNKILRAKDSVQKVLDEDV